MTPNTATSTTTKPVTPAMPIDASDDLTLDIERYDEPCPEGRHPARLIDIVDVGEEESFGKQVRKIWLVWQVFPVDEETGQTRQQSSGAPYKVDKKYTRSLFPGNNSVQPSGLFADIDTWTGGQLSGGKLKKFSLNDLYKLPCYVTIEEKISGNNTYTNVTAIEPWDGDVPPEADRASYERSDYSKRKPKARDAASVIGAPFVNNGTNGGPVKTEDYVPF